MKEYKTSEIIQREKEIMKSSGKLNLLQEQFEDFMDTEQYHNAGRLLLMLKGQIKGMEQRLCSHLKEKYIVVTSAPEKYLNNEKYIVIPYISESDFHRRLVTEMALYIKQPETAGVIIENVGNNNFFMTTIIRLAIEYGKKILPPNGIDILPNLNNAYENFFNHSYPPPLMAENWIFRWN